MITDEKIKNAFRLARIKISEKEQDYLSSQIKNIMKMVQTLETIDCDGVEPLTSMSNSSIVFDDDNLNQTNTREELFHNVRGDTANLAKEITCYVVPKVIE